MIEHIPLPVDLPKDFFERILYLSELKYRYFLQHPVVYSFLLTVFRELSKKSLTEAKKRLSGFQRLSMPFILEGMDRSKFHENLDIEKAVSLIWDRHQNNLKMP